MARAKAAGKTAGMGAPTAATPKPGRKPRQRPGRFEQTPRSLLIGGLITLLGGTLWGVNATVSKILMNDYGADPLWIANVRQVCAGVLFLALAGATQPRALAGAVRDRRMYPRYVVGAVICVMATQITYLQAIRWTNPGTATVLQTLNLLFVLFWVCVRGRRLPGAREVVGVVLAFSGVVLLATGGDLTTLQLPLMGLLWGLADAIATASMSFVPVKALARWGNFPVQGIMFLLAGLIMTPFVRPWATAPHLDAMGVALMTFTVVGGTFGAYWLFMTGVVRIGAMRATMLGTSEPVMATVSAVLLTGAVFTPTDLLGFALILAMTFLVR